MNKFSIIVLLILVFSACSNKNIKRLSLIQSYEVVTHGHIEPSGLTWWDGGFYTVSDKDNFIYKLVFSDSLIELQPVIEIINDKGTKLDFEGITHDDDNFYLVSETHFQILKISKDGTQQEWLPNSNILKSEGLKVGLFKTKNAFFEGLCIIDKGEFLLAAERQPRGLMTFNSMTNITNAYQVDKPNFNYKEDRLPDFSGLSCDDGMYVLDRNAYIVAELNEVDGQYIEGKGYTYDHIINQKELLYEDMKYGQAEGLVVKGENIYIILDNNKESYKNRDNNNSLFLIMNK